MLRQVYQPAGAVFIAAHNVLSQRQVQERLREYMLLFLHKNSLEKQGCTSYSLCMQFQAYL